ncbi:MAG: sulfatase-like hydrolase/transferase [Blastocatellia bacterium]|nr:sulfatase-like hydrolase/transferase [Blastocatellia bacterium]
MIPQFVNLALFILLGAFAGGDAAAAQGAAVTLVNAASYEAVVAPGSIAALFGVGFTTETISAGGLPLPATLGGVTVKIGGRVAPLFFVSSSQINLQVPGGLGVGTASIEVFINNSVMPMRTGTVTIAEAAPGLFTIDATGRGQAAAVNADYSLNAEFERFPGARPELAGGVVTLFATGIGATQPPVADGYGAPASPVAVDTGVTTVTIGGANAPVLFSGLTPGLAGVWQLNVRIPDALPTNPATRVRVSKGRDSLEATLAIAGRQDFGALAGTATDGLSGARLAGATMTLPLGNGLTRTVRTNAQGAFSLPVVSVGNHNLQAAAPGFVPETQGVSVAANAVNGASFTLAKQKPNIIVIVADDLGYADLGIHGSPDIVTPHIDSIARNGVRFTAGYASAPVCAPTRAGLLTGRYQQRFGLELLPRAGQTDYGFPAGETTLARRLKSLGYATSLVGKWHLGSQGQFLPQQQGFDEFFGFLGALHSYTVWNQPNNPILRGAQPVSESTYLTDAFTREAVDFIQRKQSQPFFLYLAFNAAHSPLQATDEYLARFPNIANVRRRTFAAMMAAMDDGVGNVLAKLRELNLEENTLVVFHGDNGGDPSDNASLNTPFNGEKFQLYEGGIRVPYLMQWKGYLPAGAIHHAPVITLDVFSTALATARGRAFSDPRLDGVNLLPFLLGADPARPHEILYWRYGAPQYAMRAGDWKLLFLDNTLRLYDLAADPGERVNLAATNGAKLNELRALYDQWNAQLPLAP